MVTQKLETGHPQIMFNLNHLKAAGPMQVLTGTGEPQPGSWIQLAGEITKINIALPFPVLAQVIGAAIPAELVERIQGGFRDHMVMTPEPADKARGNTRPNGQLERP